jgi:hypothetical protein
MEMFFVLGAVRKNYLTAKATDADVEAVMKEWLKFVRVREKARRDRGRLLRVAATTTAQRCRTLIL